MPLQEQFIFGPETPPNKPAVTDTAEHSSPAQVKTDLSDFSKQVTERDKKQNEDFLAQLSEWDKQAVTPENILKIRQAGLTKEQNDQDDLTRHVQLSAAFTKPETSQDPTGQNIFSVNFQGNVLAEKYVGLGDLLPPHAEKVMVYGLEGQIITGSAVRKINPATGRIGYYDEATGAYIAVHSGFRVSIITSRTAVPRDSSAGDPVLRRRKLAEDVTVFQAPKTPDFYAADDDQKGVAPPKPETTPEPFSFSLIPNEPDPATVTPSIPEAEQPQKSFRDYSPVALKKIPPGIPDKAKEILHRGNPIGTVTVFEQDGKTYIARDEVHRHAPTDNVPPALKQNHHGVTVYEARSA